MAEGATANASRDDVIIFDKPAARTLNHALDRWLR